MLLSDLSPELLSGQQSSSSQLTAAGSNQSSSSKASSTQHSRGSSVVLLLLLLLDMTCCSYVPTSSAHQLLPAIVYPQQIRPPPPSSPRLLAPFARKSFYDHGDRQQSLDPRPQRRMDLRSDYQEGKDCSLLIRKRISTLCFCRLRESAVSFTTRRDEMVEMKWSSNVPVALMSTTISSQ